MNLDTFDLYGTTISCGRLMAPNEIQEAVQRRNGIPGLRSGWCLCGDVKKSTFDAINEHGTGVDIRLTTFIGPDDGAYATITQQLGGMQHRFLLPLYEPPVIAFFKALEQQPIQAMLGREGETPALILHNELPWRNIVPVVGMCQHNRGLAAENALAEMTWAISAVCRIDAIPSIYKGVPLTELSVSVIVPMDYCRAAAEAEEEMTEGQR